MKLFKEYAPKVNARAGVMFLLDDIVGRVGFSTVYAFDETAASEIKARRSSKGMNTYPVWSDCFVADFDNGFEDAKHLRDWAKSQGFGYQLWESGGKGAHVYIEHSPLFSHDVPYTHAKLADKIAPMCDRSLYRHGSLLRLPGTVHDRTGKPKILVESSEGDSAMQLTLVSKPKTQFDIAPVETAEEEFVFWLADLNRYTGQTPGKGNRFMLLWRLARMASECGVSAHTAHELLQIVNSSWGNDAHDASEVTRAITQGYK